MKRTWDIDLGAGARHAAVAVRLALTGSVVFDSGPTWRALGSDPWSGISLDDQVAVTVVAPIRRRVEFADGRLVRPGEGSHRGFLDIAPKSDSRPRSRGTGRRREPAAGVGSKRVVDMHRRDLAEDDSMNRQEPRSRTGIPAMAPNAPTISDVCRARISRTSTTRRRSTRCGLRRKWA